MVTIMIDEDLITDYQDRIEGIRLTVKDQIKGAYLAGLTIPIIAKAYKIADRTVYYHLGYLSSVEKKMHAKNKKASV